ncbi:tail fiber assembly protein [Pseudomonas putida]|nr:tail fiber assembly protein [Pseudomonas putida]EKT8868118.1 tail fiber assembly protein [Pseudomonas putida]
MPYFSPGTLGFIPDQWKTDGSYSDDTWPQDAILLTEEEAATYWKQSPPLGKILAAVDGRPAWVDMPPPEPLTDEELATAAAAKRDELLALAAIRIAPLQDAVDLGEATEAESTALTAWKRYRVALSRLPDQLGYPNEIIWPAPPA